MILVTACAPPPDIRIGFLGSLSGKFADTGIALRNGALLAIEQANEGGGIQGQKLMLIEQDDGQSNEQALLALDSLNRRGVVAVVGPGISSIAVAIVPRANALKLLLVAPTVSTGRLSGKDDYLLRVLGDSSAFGRSMAAQHFSVLKIRRVALAVDEANADYSEAWAESYSNEFVRLGGVVATRVRFKSGYHPDHAAIARQLLAAKPQMVISVASAQDTALIAQRVRALDAGMRLATSGWAVTPTLLIQGGAAVEGMFVQQIFDRLETSPAYLNFVSAYRTRFRVEPGYHALLAFDAANVVIAGLHKSAPAGALKNSILEIGRFQGAQSDFSLDAFGDSNRKIFYEKVKDGAFARID